MNAPPPKPKPKPKQTPEDLAEVERALSVLQGRHPEHERVRREEEERRAERKAENDAASAAAARHLRLRRVGLGFGIAAAILFSLLAVVVFKGELARRGRLEQVADPYRAIGFALVESSSRSQPSRVEANVPAGCVLAVTTAPRVRLAYAGGTVEGPAPLFTCLCEGDHVTVTSDAGRTDGILLLHAEASAFGGSRAAAFLPFKLGTVGLSDQACGEASLDAWLDTKRWQGDPPAGGGAGVRPSAPADAATSDRWFSEPKRAPLKNAGFTVTSIVSRAAPFAVVEVPAATCVLLVSERAIDKVGLRLHGGSLAVGLASDDVGWCTSTATLVLAQRDGPTPAGGGEVAVLFAPAARVGGLGGLREVARRAELTLGASGVPAADLGWSAKQLLVASAVPESLVTIGNAPDIAPDPDARIVALSLERPAALSADAPDGVYSYCDPPLARATELLCVFSGAHRWHGAPDAAAGIARTRLPFWLFAFQNVSDPAALQVETQLVAFARRLRRDGFEPTTIEAVTELDTGAEVLGRANEDAIVVVALAPIAPWVLPYTDGPAWSLDQDEPRSIPIRPLERKIVLATTKPLPPKSTRRTVVFRRQKR